jgi:hypothetical protein
MAGDWIQMRCDLIDDPDVVAISDSTGIDEYGVVGRLLKLWSWANKHLDSGNAPSVTRAWLDRYVGATGFAEAMIAVGWLKELDGCPTGGIGFPDFERYNSQGAKRRALGAKRAARHRAGSNADRNANRHADRNAPGVTSASPREEKRREEEEEKDTPPPPERPDDPRSDTATSSATTRMPSDAAARGATNSGADGHSDGSEPFDALAQSWSECRLPGHDAPGGIRRTPQRVGWWQMRLADGYWASVWREAVMRLGRSAKAKGLDAKFGKGIHIDTFLRDPDFVVRVMEGQWDDPAAATAPPPGEDKYARRLRAIKEREAREGKPYGG